MKCSSTLALGASLALIALSQAGFAQQNLPAMNPHGQVIPGINAQDVPGGGRRSTNPLNLPYTPGTRFVVDKCSLAGVGDKDLAVLRAHIVDLLKNDAAASKSFLDAESWVDKGCARERVAFYVKALARIKG
jgi:hypothetical protein